VSCPYCDQGWPIWRQLSKSQPRKHRYPDGYKGQRAGVGPYCTAEPSEEK
jgi:hypothetical protein